MPLVMQDIVDRARIPLNDADPVDANRRDPDAVLLKHAKSGLQILRTKRPDLFFGAIATFSAEGLGPNDPFPLPEDLAPAVQDWITARAHAKDDEAVTQGTASAFFSLFAAEA